MMRPSLPEKLGDLDDTRQSREMELYRRHLVHYHYLQSAAEHNELHYTALAGPMDVFRCPLFCRASDPWEGKTLTLKVALTKGTKNGEMLAGGSPPCPIVFNPDDICRTMKLDEEQREADEGQEA